MRITKQFEFECSHLVSNASSTRCSRSIHGHSYKCYITLAATHLDNACMVYDFGLFKGPIKEFVDSMDHCHMMYSGMPQEHRDFFKKNNERWIEVPFIPSAEMMSVYVLKNIQHILNNIIMNNGEGRVYVESVQIYETRTGSATAYEEDLLLWKEDWDVQYSDGVLMDWGSNLKKIIFFDEKVLNPSVQLQVPKP